MRRHAKAIVVFSAVLMSSLGASAPLAGAADNCPNAALRVGPSAGLGECRAYEMVSPANKEGSFVDPKMVVQRSDSGAAVAFPGSGGFAGAETSLLDSYYIARRTGSGWAPESLDAPQFNQLSSGGVLARPSLYLSSDLSTTFQLGTTALLPGAFEGGSSIFRRDNATAGRVLVASTPSVKMAAEMAAATGRRSLALADDQSVFAFTSPSPLAPGVPADAAASYEYREGVLAPLRLPDESIPTDGSIIGTGAGGSILGSRSISADGDRLFFRSPSTGPLYVRVDGETTVPISVSQREGASDEPLSADFIGASPDGSSVIFSSGAELTDDKGSGLYRLDLESEELTLITKPFSGEPFGIPPGAIAVSPDGETVLFMSFERFTEDAFEFDFNLYVYGNGQIRYLGSIGSSPAVTKVAFSPDSRYMAFQTQNPLTGFDSSGPGCDPEWGPDCMEVFRYDTVEDDLVCVSCRNPGASRDSYLGGGGTGVSGVISEYIPKAVGDNGDVFFDSSTSYVPADTNGTRDVYRWRGGEYTLISTGKGRFRSFFAEASEDGSEVFFTTPGSLVGIDVDGESDLYVARVNGGFASQQASLRMPECEGEECQGERSAAPQPAPVGSAAPGGVERPRLSGARAVTGSTATLTVRVAGAGRIAASGPMVRAVAKQAGSAGAYRLKLRLRPSARSTLRTKGKVTSAVVVRFVPAEGPAAATQTEITFKSSRKGR